MSLCSSLLPNAGGCGPAAVLLLCKSNESLKGVGRTALLSVSKNVRNTHEMMIINRSVLLHNGDNKKNLCAPVDTSRYPHVLYNAHITLVDKNQLESKHWGFSHIAESPLSKCICFLFLFCLIPLDLHITINRTCRFFAHLRFMDSPRSSSSCWECNLC